MKAQPLDYEPYWRITSTSPEQLPEKIHTYNQFTEILHQYNVTTPLELVMKYRGAPPLHSYNTILKCLMNTIKISSLGQKLFFISEDSLNNVCMLQFDMVIFSISPETKHPVSKLIPMLNASQDLPFLQKTTMKNVFIQQLIRQEFIHDVSAKLTESSSECKST